MESLSVGNRCVKNCENAELTQWAHSPHLVTGPFSGICTESKKQWSYLEMCVRNWPLHSDSSLILCRQMYWLRDLCWLFYISIPWMASIIFWVTIAFIFSISDKTVTQTIKFLFKSHLVDKRQKWDLNFWNDFKVHVLSTSTVWHLLMPMCFLNWPWR